MPSPRERAKFWDDRILDWEAARYEGRWPGALGPVEWLAAWRSGPTRLRQRLGLDLLAPYVAGRRVVEVGCGSGLLARGLIGAGARSYLGLDHSRVAIEAARRRHLDSPAQGRIRFEVRPAQELPGDCDLVVSLGLLDWLTDGELETFWRRHGAADFLHTFSERRPRPTQLLHRACRALHRLLRPRAVRPRFMALDEVLGTFAAPARVPLSVYRDRKLRSAAFLSSLALRGGTPR